jgi:predicted PurR-regulated permease PerM
MKNIGVELLALVLFFAVLYLIYVGRIKDKPNDFKAYRDSLETQIKVLQNNIDSLNQIERIQTIKKTIINNYHDSIQTIIIYLPDSANTKLLLSNIGRYNHLSKLSPSQGN